MKKSMKKIIAIITVLALALAVGGYYVYSDQYADSFYTGEWQTVTGDYNGVSVRMKDVVGTMTLALEPNGAAQVASDEETLKGRWKPVGNQGATLTIKDKTFQIEKESKNAIMLKKDGITIHLKKVGESTIVE